MSTVLDTFLIGHYKKLIKTAKNIFKNSEGEDALNDCILKLYDIPLIKIKQMIDYDYLEYYIIRMLVNERNKESNKKSKQKYEDFYDNDEGIYGSEEMYTENDFEERLQRENEIEEKYKDTIIFLKKHCTWFDREVFLRYHMKYGSFSKFADDTKIAKGTLYNSYKRTKNKILKWEENCQNTKPADEI